MTNVKGNTKFFVKLNMHVGTAGGTYCLLANHSVGNAWFGQFVSYRWDGRLLEFQQVRYLENYRAISNLSVLCQQLEYLSLDERRMCNCFDGDDIEKHGRNNEGI